MRPASFLIGLSLAVTAAACERTAPSATGAEGQPSTEQQTVAAVSELPPRCGKTARRLIAEGATLLDVREQDEFDERHIEGAKHIPVGSVATRLSELPKDKPVVTYCRSGGRAARASSVLENAGYEVYQLGGIGDWDRTDCD